MKKLFYVGDGRSIQYFDNKMDAKKVRDAMGGPEKGYYVRLGPDHMGRHGMGPVPRMRRRPPRT